jgi:hypothetical protein
LGPLDNVSGSFGFYEIFNDTMVLIILWEKRNRRFLKPFTFMVRGPHFIFDFKALKCLVASV